MKTILFLALFLFLSGVCYAAPGDPVIIEVFTHDLFVGVEGDIPGTVLLMPSEIPYCISMFNNGLGMGRQDIHTGKCPEEFFIIITNKYRMYKTSNDLAGGTK